jgi:hypothetical protein
VQPSFADIGSIFTATIPFVAEELRSISMRCWQTWHWKKATKGSLKPSNYGFDPIRPRNVMANCLPEFSRVWAYNPRIDGSSSKIQILPTLAWGVTIAELVLGLLLIVGLWRKPTAVLAALLTLSFALSMTVVLGPHEPLNYSVFVFAFASLYLGLSQDVE